MDHNKAAFITTIWIIYYVFITCQGAVLKKAPSDGDLQIYLGQSGHLKCKLSCFLVCFNYTMTWEKEGTNMDTGETFRIKSATYEDVGNYTCFTNYINKYYDGEFNVIIQGWPIGTPRISPQKLLVRVLETFSLTCNTSGIHKGVPEGNEYDWYKDGEPDEDNHHEVYRHTPQVVSTGGVYRCKLKNMFGSSCPANSTVTVEAPPVIEVPATNQCYQPRYDDQDFNISFIISGSHLTNFTLSSNNLTSRINYFNMNNEPLNGHFKYGQQKAQFITFQWILDDVNLNSCNDVTYFNGIYKFEVEGFVAGAVSSQESMFSINVKYPAMWKRGKNESSLRCKPKTLYCDVCAEPAPTKYSWFFMGEELDNATGEKLYLRNTSSTDFGWYTCTVTNYIDGVEHDASFNINLDENGTLNAPMNFKVISLTSKTILVAWDVMVNPCYELEFEFQIWISTSLHRKMTYKNCRVQDHCEFRIGILQPRTEYILQIRAKTGWSYKDYFYSKYVRVEGKTAARPVFEPMPPKVTETTIFVSWKYGRKGAEYLDTTEQVTVAVQYKKTGALNFTRYPEDRNIPAENKIAQMDGSFDTSAIYIIVYEVYEGDQLAIQTTPEEITSTGSDAIIILSVIGAVIGIGVLGLVFGLWCHKKRSQKRDTCFHPGASSRSNAGYEGNRTTGDSTTNYPGLEKEEGLDYEKLDSTGNEGNEYTELENMPVPTDVSYDDVLPELDPLPPNNEKITGSGSPHAQQLNLKENSVPTDVSYDDVLPDLDQLPPNNEKITGSGSPQAQHLYRKNKSGDDYQLDYVNVN